MLYSYTERMEEALWQKWSDYDTDAEYASTIEFLNAEDGFRSFGDGLVALMQKKDPSMDADKSVAHLTACCKKNGVELHDIGCINKLKSWLNGGPRPKKGIDSRESLFALAFALEFTPEEAAELFHKVYLDRAFNFRNEKELVYYFCLANRKSWTDAKRIIASIEHDSDAYDATLHTAEIQTDVDNFSNESELLAFIKTHRHNMEQNNVMAKKHLADLYEKAKKCAIEEAEQKGHEEDFIRTWRKEKTASVNFVYSVITNLKPSAKQGTTTVFKNARLPKEIKNRFPEAGSFSEKEPTYESMRKMIIMLFSYAFWYNVQFPKANTPKFDEVDYREQLNALLNECGFSPLYDGNPYDWLFLFCIWCCTQANSDYHKPLDVFRTIIAEVLNEEE